MNTRKNGERSSDTQNSQNPNNDQNSIPVPPYIDDECKAKVNSNIRSGDQSQRQPADTTPNPNSPMRNPLVTAANFRYPEMVGRVVKFGNHSSIIKGDIICNNQEFFALECEKSMSGYNGLCPRCNGEHVKLSQYRGYYADIKSVQAILGQKEKEQKRLQGRKKPHELLTIEGDCPPLDKPKLGKNKGIEGDSNSCYMDATIFCMFTYSNIFDTLLNMPVDPAPSKKVQTLLKENIVNVLRSESGFVERDALYNLRVQLSEATKDKSFVEVEKDPSEFLRALEELFDYAPLHTIPPNQPPEKNRKNITTNIMWEMFDANPGELKSTKIASIFRNSLTEIPAKLATIPPFLILVAPRHTRTQRSYRYIIPDQQITLDNTLVQLVCLNCGKPNHQSEKQDDFFSCVDCLHKEPSLLTTPSTNASVASYCGSCMKKLHDELQSKIEHTPKQMKNIATLNLSAVLCIELAHYVAFVKCHKADGEHEWLFFDSMSDRIDNETNVPRVSRVLDFNRWINQAEKDEYFFDNLDKRRSQGKPMSQSFNEEEMRQLRLFRDGAFFFYENSNADYQ